MSVVRGQAQRRWAAVAVGVALLCATPSAVGAVQDAASSSATVAPRELLARVQRSDAVAYQGLAESRGRLGLPDLPRTGDAAALLGTTTRARVWFDSSRRWRVDRLLPGGEEDDYQTPEGVATWRFEEGDIHLVTSEPRLHLPRTIDLLPPEVARRLLASVLPGDRVTALTSTRIGGLAASGLRLEPADARSTVARVDVWAEPRTGLPLRVQVVARGGSAAAFRSGFLSVRLGRPAAGQTRLVAPPGTRVEHRGYPDLVAAAAAYSGGTMPSSAGALPRNDDVRGLAGAAGYGDGLVRVVAVRVPDDIAWRILAAVPALPDLKVEGTRAVLIPTALVNTVVATTDHGDAYLISGTARRDVLIAVLKDLT